MQRRFDHRGPLALAPTAFMGMFLESPKPPERPVLISGDVAIIDVQGPLVHHVGSWEDSYDHIVDRVTVALSMPEVRAVVLRVDSPGGVMHGAFDCARILRERATSASKPLISWISGDGCSAAYALACAAERIYVSASACIGSIGVLFPRVDTTAADAAIGASYTLFQSGARKPYGNPHVRVSPGEMATAQAQVDALAEVFFETVSTLRPALSVDALRALEAGIFVGAEAVALGLADGVEADLQAAVAAAGGGTMPVEDEEQATQSAPSSSQADVDDAREALQRAANDGSDRARRALAVLEGDEGDEGPGDEDEDDDEESASASAAGAGASAESAPGASASAGGATVSAQAAASIAVENEDLRARIGRLEAQAEHSQMTALLASRKDLSKELRAKLRTMPLAEARAMASLIPRQDRQPAAGTVVRGSAPDPSGMGGRPSSRPGGQPAGAPVGDPRMQRAFAQGATQQLVERNPLQTTFRAPSQPRRFSTYSAPKPAQAATQAAPSETGTGGDR